MERCGDAAPSPENKRRHGRLVVQETGCSVGKIEDLSCSGMRITTRFKMKPGPKSIGMRIETLDGPTVLPCKIVWARRIGLRKWSVGLEFTAMTMDQRRMLSDLAKAVSRNECMRPMPRKAG